MGNHSSASGYLSTSTPKPLPDLPLALPLRAPPPPNSDSSDVCPLSFSRWCAAARSDARPMAAKSFARDTPFDAATPSNAPDFTSASSTLRLTLRPSTRLQKSNSDRNGPPSSRAALITSTAPSPTPLTAPSPKRITLCFRASFLPSSLPLFLTGSALRDTTVKSVSDSLMSGRCTVEPHARAPRR